MAIRSLTVRVGLSPIMPVKPPASIDIKLSFDGDGVGTCKQNLSPFWKYSV